MQLCAVILTLALKLAVKNCPWYVTLKLFK